MYLKNDPLLVNGPEKQQTQSHFFCPDTKEVAEEKVVAVEFLRGLSARTSGHDPKLAPRRKGLRHRVMLIRLASLRKASKGNSKAA